MATVIYSAMVPLEPRTKKNSQEIISIKDKKTGRSKPIIVQSKIYKQYEKDAGWFLRRPSGGTITGQINVRCIFYRSTRRKVDLTNLLEAVDDILVKYRIIEDDDFLHIAGHDGSRVFIDKERPRTEIYIEKFTGEV